jgi:hypothetical protein
VGLVDVGCAGEGVIVVGSGLVAEVIHHTRRLWSWNFCYLKQSEDLRMGSDVASYLVRFYSHDGKGPDPALSLGVGFGVV